MILPPAALAAFAAALGACVGSFLNVCIHRMPERRSIVHPRSSCPACAAPIAWYDNLPVLSWILLGARCRRCRAPIAWTYPAVEAATALLFLVLFLLRGPTPAFLDQAWLGASLIALMIIDYRHQILPDALTLPGIAVGLAFSLLRPGAGSLIGPEGPVREAFAGALLGYAIPWAINALYHAWQAIRRVPRAAREDGIGQGDFKLLAMIGAFLGPAVLLFVLFLGNIAGAVVGLALMRLRGYGWKSRLPLGVFLGAAGIVAILVGRPWVDWYLGLAGFGP